MIIFTNVGSLSTDQFDLQVTVVKFVGYSSTLLPLIFWPPTLYPPLKFGMLKLELKSSPWRAMLETYRAHAGTGLAGGALVTPFPQFQTLTERRALVSY